MVEAVPEFEVGEGKQMSYLCHGYAGSPCGGQTDNEGKLCDDCVKKNELRAGINNPIYQAKARALAFFSSKSLATLRIMGLVSAGGNYVHSRVKLWNLDAHKWAEDNYKKFLKRQDSGGVTEEEFDELFGLTVERISDGSWAGEGSVLDEFEIVLTGIDDGIVVLTKSELREKIISQGGLCLCGKRLDFWHSRNDGKASKPCTVQGHNPSKAKIKRDGLVSTKDGIFAMHRGCNAKTLSRDISMERMRETLTALQDEIGLKFWAKDSLTARTRLTESTDFYPPQADAAAAGL